MLGVGHEAVVDLIDYNCLTAMRGPDVDGYPIWIIKPDDVAALLNRLEEKSITMVGSANCYIDMAKAVRKMSIIGFSIGSLAEHVLSEKIAVYDKGAGSGLGRFLYSESEISNFISLEVNENKKGYLTVIEVAHRLKVKQEVASFWIDKGFIKCDGHFNNSKKKLRRKISQEALEQFTEKYVLLSQKAAALGTSPKYLLELLQTDGIYPVSGPSVDGGRQYLLRRSPYLMEFQFGA